MTHVRFVTSLGLIALLAAPSSAVAQHRGRGDQRAEHRRPDQGRPAQQRAVPRGSVRGGRPQIVTVAPYYYRGFRPGLNLGFYGYPGYYGYPYSYGYGYGYGYGYPAFGYRGYGYPGYGYPGYGYSGYGYPPYGYPGYAVSGRPYGGVRIDLPQRDAEVYVDGYFVGIVDDFDGAFQHVNVEAGPHRIEVRAPGFETIAFEVNIEPGQTITYRAPMRPLQP
jgi:PEGA domain-containing protein